MTGAMITPCIISGSALLPRTALYSLPADLSKNLVQELDRQAAPVELAECLTDGRSCHRFPVQLSHMMPPRPVDVQMHRAVNAIL
jgi:hypothetical protein